MSDNPISAECLVHYNNQHIQVRKDFFDLCAYNKDAFNQGTTKSGKKTKNEPNQECMAKILRVLETLTNHERMKWYLKANRLKARGSVPPKEPKECPIELAYSTISDLLYGTYGESTIRKSIAALIQMGYVKRYQKTKNSVPCYILDVSVLQAALEQQAKAPSDSEVLNLTPEEDEVSILQAELLKVTPEPVNLTPELLKVTPNKKDNKITTKKDIEERKNGNITAKQEATHSSIHSSSSHFQNSSQETKPEEVILSEEEQAIYDYACQTIFKAKPPRKIAKIQGECAKIAEHVQTVEQFISLVHFVRALPYIQGQIHLKNLVNELNGWLQTQQKPTVSSLDTVQPEKPRQITNLLELYQMQEALRKEEAAQREGSVV